MLACTGVLLKLNDISWLLSRISLTTFLNPEILKEHVKISDSTTKHAEWINEYAELGFDEIVVHNVNTNQEQFIEDFGAKVLTQF